MDHHTGGLRKKNRRILEAARRAGSPVTLILGLAGCLDYPTEPPLKHSQQSPASLYAPNFDGRTFFNPWNRFDWRRLDFLRFAFTRSPYDKSRSPQLRVVANDGASLGGAQQSAEITWVGHASFVIHDGDDVVLTDPHFSKRARTTTKMVKTTGFPLDCR
jgi:hypothetical protein